MSKAVPMGVTDRCELCGEPWSATFTDRFGHLRREHPAYARGLLLRLVAPLGFLVGVVVLAVFHAPQIAFLVGLFLSFGVLLIGKLQSRSARAKAGLPATLPMKRLLREGGLGIMLLIPVVVLLVLALSRR